MNQNHRYFVQYILKNGVLSVENAMKYCKHVSKGEIDNATSFKNLVIETNREISKQFYKLAFMTCEVTNENMIIWLNTKNDDISKLQHTFSAIDLEYFHAILQEILISDNYRITSIACINITSTLTGTFSRDQGQKVLSKWLKGGYFIQKDGYIYLGPRLILEFTSYLKTHCPNSICTLCSELVFMGKRCSTCAKTFHTNCLTKYMSNQNDCPSCHNPWREFQTTEEEEISQEHTDDIEVSQSSQRSRKKSKRNQLRVSEENDSEPGPSTRRRVRSPCF